MLEIMQIHGPRWGASLSTEGAGRCYCQATPSSLKGHREQEGCLTTGGKPVALQSSKRAERGTQ